MAAQKEVNSKVWTKLNNVGLDIEQYTGHKNKSKRKAVQWGLLRILCKVQAKVKLKLAGRVLSLLFQFNNITEIRQKIKP